MFFLCTLILNPYLKSNSMVFPMSIFFKYCFIIIGNPENQRNALCSDHLVNEHFPGFQEFLYRKLASETPNLALDLDFQNMFFMPNS